MNKHLAVLVVMMTVIALPARNIVRPFSDEPNQGNGIGVKVGYEYQRSSYVEAGVLFLHWTGMKGYPFGFKGILVGGECRVGGSQVYAGPKVSAELSGLFFGTRASITYLIGGGHKALTLAPEFGFSWLGRLYIYFGYNINLTGRKDLDMTGFKVSVGVNLYKLGSVGD